jgi:tetratricopeptide (TPR) repeat protein
MVPGSTFDRYTIEAVIGQGGMGTVYRAYDAKLQRAVALKLLLRDPAAPSERQGDGNARLLREARAAAALSHANAVAIYDVGEHDGVAFISMELVEGRSLRAFVGDAGIPMPSRMAILVDVARALAAAHVRGLIHRDVKPENVMIRADGAVKVLDFGLARALVDEGRPPAAGSESTARRSPLAATDSAMAGTPRYMAPEQIRGEPLDARTDQFSWGVLAYELLTGRPPWPGDTASLSRLVALDTDPPIPWPGLVDPAVPPAASDAIMRALAKAPSDRFASMGDVAMALAGPTDPHVLPTPAHPRLGRRRARRALVVLPLILLAAALVVSFAHFFPRGSRPAPPATPPALPPPAPTAVLDLPIPSSEIPAAKAAYVTALHALHEGSPALALPSFIHAAELDPSMAAAHLRIAMWGQFNPIAPEHLAKAAELRARLSERDERVLWILEPLYMVTPPDDAETSRRTRAVAPRWPLDAELQAWAATRQEEPQAELELYERVLSIDPTFGYAFVRVANVHSLLGDSTRAIAALDRCLAVAPSSSGCLMTRASYYDETGRCVDMERDARFLASSGSSVRSQDFVARALYANGAPTQAVHAALELKWAAASSAQREDVRRQDEAHLAILRGDFVEAERLQRAIAAGSADAPTEDEHATAVIPWIDLALEMGESARAARLADAYVKSRSGWQSEGAWSRLPEVLVVAFHGGLLSAEQRGAELAAWMKQWGAITGPLHTQQWILGSAIPATTAADAVAALDAAPTPLPHVHSNQFHREGLEAVGRVLLLAGRATEAVPHLRAAVASCSALQVPLELTQAELHLGEALEQTGDRPGACAAYAVVLARWGAAKPRSMTAEKARSRRHALACP